MSGPVVILSVNNSIFRAVQVYTGTVLTSLSQVASFSQPFNAVAGTTYQIQVGGGPGAIELVITAPPILKISSPQNGASSPAPASFTISASATDSDGSISRLAFYADGELFGSTPNSSLSVNWTNVGVGTHYLFVQATDNLGAKRPSNLTVTVHSP